MSNNIRKMIKYVLDPDYRFNHNASRGRYNNLSDEEYLSAKFFHILGSKLDLQHPVTFNEKMQWLKLYHRDDIFTTMVDKYESKQLVANIIGERYVIPAFGVWDSFDDIDFESLPNSFVLKTTHDCGGVLICKDKNSFDFVTAKLFIEKHLKNNYYLWCREWPYKNVQPRVLAEKYMKDEGNIDLPVYKVFTFSGEPYMIQVIQNDKQKDESIDYFDIEWNKLNLRQNFPNSNEPLKRPNKLEEMLELSGKLSYNLPFLRTDFYVINEDIYFSEFTFFSDAGFAKFYPSDWDEKLGNMIVLPSVKKV